MTIKYNPIAHLKNFGNTKTKRPTIIARIAEIVKFIATIKKLKD